MTNKLLVINARAHTISIKTEEEHLFNLGMVGHDMESAEVVDEETRQEILPMDADAAAKYITDPVNGWDEEDIKRGKYAIAKFRAFTEGFHIDGLPEKIDRNAREIWERMVEIGSLASCISAVEPEVGDPISKEVGIICEALNRLRHAAQMSDHYCEE